MITLETNDLVNYLRDLHTPVREWRIDMGRDWSGDEAVWVWGIIDDATLAALTPSELAQIRRKIHDSVASTWANNELIVYTRFVAASEA